MPRRKAETKTEQPPEEKGPALPSPHEIRTAHKADLVKWCEEFRLDPEGKVEDLRKRLLAHVESKEVAEPKEPGAEGPMEPGEEEAETGEEAEEALEIPEEEEKIAVKGEEEEGSRVKPKAELDPTLRRLLRLRAETSRRRPEFLRQEWYRYQRLGLVWRRPRGMDSKRRRRFQGRTPVVRVGYRGPAAVRGLHPSGFKEVVVHRPQDLEGLDPKRQAARVAGSVGTRKRMEIEEKAEELGIRLLNPLAEE